MTIRTFRARFRGPWKIVEGEGSIQVWAGSYCLLYIYPHTAAWQDVATTGLHKLTWAEGLTLARAIQRLGKEAGTMSDIDRQRVRGVEVLREMGFTWHEGRWELPSYPAAAGGGVPEADTMHRLLVERSDKLTGCTEGSDEAAELASIIEGVETYEANRWPKGKEPGGKG